MVTCSFSCVPDAIADPGAVAEVDWGLTVDRLIVDELMVDGLIVDGLIVDGFVVLLWMQLLLHSLQKNFVMIVHYRSRVFVGPRLKVLLAGSHPCG